MIFDHHDYWDMGLANRRLASLVFQSQGSLTNVLIKISTLDDPYYSRLPPRTYMAAARLASPSEIASLVERFGS